MKSKSSKKSSSRSSLPTVIEGVYAYLPNSWFYKWNNVLIAYKINKSVVSLEVVIMSNVTPSGYTSKIMGNLHVDKNKKKCMIINDNDKKFLYVPDEKTDLYAIFSLDSSYLDNKKYKNIQKILKSCTSNKEIDIKDLDKKGTNVMENKDYETRVGYF